MKSEINFSLLIDKYRDYYRKMDKQDPSFAKDLAMEADKKLNQMEFIIKRVIELEEQNHILHENMEDRPKISLAIKNGKELELLTECFYYISFRTMKIIINLPYLKSFKSPGIRDVRNHLLEHPEGKDSEVFINSFGYGAPQGPVIKAARYSHQESIHPDRGLYANYLEFQKNLNTLLTNLISK